MSSDDRPGLDAFKDEGFPKCQHTHTMKLPVRHKEVKRSRHQSLAENYLKGQPIPRGCVLRRSKSEIFVDRSKLCCAEEVETVGHSRVLTAHCAERSTQYLLRTVSLPRPGVRTQQSVRSFFSIMYYIKKDGFLDGHHPNPPRLHKDGIQVPWTDRRTFQRTALSTAPTWVDRFHPPAHWM